MAEQKMKQLAKSIELLESMIDTHHQMISNLTCANRLLLECVSRIAGNISPDAQQDAKNTLRGCAIFALEHLLNDECLR